MNSHIRDGQTIRVFYTYIGMDPWSTAKVRYCRSDPRIHINGPQNTIWRWCTEPVDYLNADLFNLEMDEIRVLGWDYRCQNSGKNNSELLAEDIHYYYQTIRKKNPAAGIMMWSDMLDPEHHARDYKTTALAGQLRKRGMQDIIMVPWDHTIADQSVSFLVQKGFAVMASVQDEMDDLSSAPLWAYYLHKHFTLLQNNCGLMHAPWHYELDTKSGLKRAQYSADFAWSSAPYIEHMPVRRAARDQPLVISAKVYGDPIHYDGKQIKKGALPLKTATLYYRRPGEEFQKIKMKIHKDQTRAQVPIHALTGAELDYYIEASTTLQLKRAPVSAPADYHVIKLY
jgi:hypothetical protein